MLLAVLLLSVHLCFQINTFWKAKKWFHLIFALQVHFKGLIKGQALDKFSFFFFWLIQFRWLWHEKT